LYSRRVQVLSRPGAKGDRATDQDLRWLGSSAHGCGGSHQFWYQSFGSTRGTT
ncbi:hypothetical protein LINPERPRIM_LOCUS37861, partial [Linum perenne]